MPYTIMSEGRPIGTSDLAFARIGGPSRVGWFFPNPEGERLMPLITAMHQAVQAAARMHGPPLEAPPFPELGSCSHHADILEAMHHVAALDLTLHHPDGSLIPTEFVALQDMEQLLAWLAIADEWDDARPWHPDRDTEEAEIERAAGHDRAVLEELRGEAEEGDDAMDAWAGDPDWGDDEPLPRYQVCVFLESDSDIP